VTHAASPLELGVADHRRDARADRFDGFHELRVRRQLLVQRKLLNLNMFNQ
jgi:hypothetical protein